MYFIPALKDYRTLWERAASHFRYIFADIECGYQLCVWFLRDLKVVTVVVAAFLVKHFPGESTAHFKLCNNCYKVFKMNNVTSTGRSNDYRAGNNNMQMRFSHRQYS